MTMLSLQNIAIHYNKVPAVHDVSIEVNEGEIVALVGGNGNGKSSTLRAIAGLNPVAQGKIIFDGKDITQVPAHQRTGLGLSLVPEGRRLFPKLTVEKNLRLGAFTRRDAFYRTMILRGLQVPDDYIVETGYWGDPAYEHAKRILSLPLRPTAFFAANDAIAIGILQAARDLGLRVPQDVSIVGYDDSRFATDADPPLTTVRQPLAEMGRLAVTLLMQRIEGQAVPLKTHLLPAELVLRKSTAPPLS